MLICPRPAKAVRRAVLLSSQRCRPNLRPSRREWIARDDLPPDVFVAAPGELHPEDRQRIGPVTDEAGTDEAGTDEPPADEPGLPQLSALLAGRQYLRRLRQGRRARRQARGRRRQPGRHLS